MNTLADWYPIILGLLAALAAGLMGSFALMKRMTLAGDTMSHIALPGLGLALLWNIQPVIGAAATLAAGAVLIWRIEQKTGLATETTIGVIFTAALAVGALITPSEDLIEALFGQQRNIAFPEFALYVALSMVVLTFVAKYRNQLVISMFNPDLGQTSGINVSRLQLIYLLIFGLTLLLGLRFLGTLLMGSLIIIPAATARQLSNTLSDFLSSSAIASMLSVILGYWLAGTYHLQLGPTVVSIAAGLFVLSLLKKKE